MEKYGVRIFHEEKLEEAYSMVHIHASGLVASQPQ